MVSDTKVNVGAIKVTFDTNGGKWSDGTDTDKVVKCSRWYSNSARRTNKRWLSILGLGF